MPDWQALFVPEHSLLEIALRGTIMYLALLLVMRFVMQRQAGAVSLADLLVIVLIADVSQNAFSNEYKSLTEGLLLVLTIVGWNYAIDWLAFRVPAFERFITPKRLPLVVDGRICWRNMRAGDDHARRVDEPASPARHRRSRPRSARLARRRRFHQRDPPR
ncbi:uncharacterized membrane protein YcaP (DUF421 family) [Methylorubrum pseudosasae]|nr:uncharacterized membrane protein YcaP (DUF421 family) [Methylorubrum pseudosasae]